MTACGICATATGKRIERCPTAGILGLYDGLAQIEVADALGERTPFGRPRGAGGPRNAQAAQPQRNPGGPGSRSPGDGRMPKGSCFRLAACNASGPDRPWRSGRPKGPRAASIPRYRDRPGSCRRARSSPRRSPGDVSPSRVSMSSSQGGLRAAGGDVRRLRARPGIGEDARDRSAARKTHSLIFSSFPPAEAAEAVRTLGSSFPSGRRYGYVSKDSSAISCILSWRKMSGSWCLS